MIVQPATATIPQPRGQSVETMPDAGFMRAFRSFEAVLPVESDGAALIGPATVAAPGTTDGDEDDPVDALPLPVALPPVPPPVVPSPLFGNPVPGAVAVAPSDLAGLVDRVGPIAAGPAVQTEVRAAEAGSVDRSDRQPMTPAPEAEPGGQPLRATALAAMPDPADPSKADPSKAEPAPVMTASAPPFEAPPAGPARIVAEGTQIAATVHQNPVDARFPQRRSMAEQVWLARDHAAVRPDAPAVDPGAEAGQVPVSPPGAAATGIVRSGTGVADRNRVPGPEGIDAPVSPAPDTAPSPITNGSAAVASPDAGNTPAPLGSPGEAMPPDAFAIASSPAASGSSAGPPAASLPASLPPTVGTALLSVAANPSDGGVTLILSPDELGPLHVRMTQGEGGLHVTLSADRPETLDLLRRHAGELAQELRQAGFASPTFSFTQGNDPEGSGRASAPPSFEVEAQASVPSGGNPASAPFPALATTIGGRGLDIRL